MSAHRPIERPKVSVALPVYNGERFLAQAVESVLDQSFTDLELVICDNASTDATRAISESFACRDRRVRYHRNPTNLGAAPNYNKAFALSRGQYFKWLAHDDLILPDYLQETVAALDARPDLVLCNTAVDVIDEAGKVIGSYASVLGRADLQSPADRFALFVIEPHTGVDIFGLMRRTALEGSVLHPSFHGADRALLAQLALRGPMLQLPARLHQIREHANRYTRQASSARFRALWHDATRRPSRQVPILQLYTTYRHIVRDADLGPDERRRCNRALARWWLANWNSLRVAVDLLATAVPGIVGMAEGLKVKLAGRSVGHFEPPARTEQARGFGAAGSKDDRPRADRPVDKATEPR